MGGAGQGAVLPISCHVEPQASKPHALLANNAYPAIYPFDVLCHSTSFCILVAD